MGDLFDLEVEHRNENEPQFKNSWQKIILLILCLVCFCILAYAIYNTFEILSLLFALYFAYSCITINPYIVESLITTPILTYYSIFLTITLLFSVEDFKNNRDLIALLVTNMLICMALFFTKAKYIVYLFVFSNSYVVARIIMFFLKDNDELIPDSECILKRRKDKK